MREELADALDVVSIVEPTHDSPEDRFGALVDKAQIRDLIMAYGYLCDARRWDELLDLYTDDIERTLAGTLREQVKGKRELREKLERPTLERRDRAGAAPPPERLRSLEFRHLMASEVIKLLGDGTAAKACVQYALVATSEAKGELKRGVHEGTYIFGFKKLNGEWKFSSQLIYSDNARNPLFQKS